MQIENVSEQDVDEISGSMREVAGGWRKFYKRSFIT